MALHHGQLSALAKLISDASKVVEAHFAKSSKPYVPSLDDTEPHPLDIQLTGKELRTAIQTIEGACAQLSATVARPSHTITNKLMGICESNCLNVALTFKIPDVLKEKPTGMHISEISKKTGLEERKAGRILRLLATNHVFREVSENIFTNNRLSTQLLSTNPLSSMGLSSTDEISKAVTFLSEVLVDKEWGHSYSPSQTAFNKSTGYPEPIYMYFEKDIPRGVELGARFGLGMVGWNDAVAAKAVVYEFPWEELGNGATVCDVACGVGNISVQLAKAHPNLRLILQDLPERIQQAKNEIWTKECPEAIAERRITFEPIDFFESSPVPGCNVYFLKNIIHNWPDAESIKILSGVKKAMAPHSRVLVHEYIIQPANRVPEEMSPIKQAPEPLLPNFGGGRIRQYNLDLRMMAMLNSEERRLPEFIRLGEAAGLEFVKLWDLGEMGLVEYRLPKAQQNTCG